MAGAALNRLARAVSGKAVETGEVQALVLQGYGKLRGAAYLLLEVTNPTAAREWLARTYDAVTLGEARPEEQALNVAFTAAGLAKLGVPEATVAGFSLEFVEGMTSEHRSRLLGDAGAAAPTLWAWGGPEATPVHVLLLLFATTADAVARLLDEQRTQANDHGLREVTTLQTRDIGRGEHFGFRDGLAQPSLAGIGRPAAPLHTINAGEFLLGYPNEHGQLQRTPLIAATDDPKAALPPDPAGSSSHDFGRNGSYLVLRSLSQDVGAFWRYADQATRLPDGSSDEVARTALAARMVGRWPSGAPLTLSPDQDRPDLATHNDFAYQVEDAEGFGCPIGAHVRRTNPRDSQPPDPGTEKSVAVNKRHRLIRRGRSYGPPVEPGAALSESDTADVRGLHFIALCADIARQFEFVSHTWAQNPHFAGLYDDADPLLGGHTGEGTGFTVQGRPVRRRYRELPVVVTVRGGAYFFLPGARALRFLAAG